MQLTGTLAHVLTVPAPAGATIDDVSATASTVAFSQTPVAANPREGVSEVWLEHFGDPSDNELTLGLFSQQIDFSSASASCSTHAGSMRACPVVQTGRTVFG